MHLTYTFIMSLNSVTNQLGEGGKEVDLLSFPHSFFLLRKYVITVDRKLLGRGDTLGVGLGVFSF